MTNIVDIKGSEAVQKVLRVMRDPNALRRAIDREYPGGNIQSCNYTAGAIFNLINGSMANSPIRAEPNTVVGIESLLDQPRVIYVGITPDHHFIVVPVGSSRLVILQGFQGTYDLLDWLRSPGAGVRTCASFVTDMTELLSLNPVTRENAAVRLFSIPGKDFDIRQYYHGTAVRIKHVNSALL